MMLNLMEVASSSSATTGGDTRQEEVAQISSRFSAAAAVTHTLHCIGYASERTGVDGSFYSASEFYLFGAVITRWMLTII